MKPITFPRFLRTLRYIVRDLCWMVAYISLAFAVAGIARAVFLLIESVATRGIK